MMNRMLLLIALLSTRDVIGFGFTARTKKTSLLQQRSQHRWTVGKTQYKMSTEAEEGQQQKEKEPILHEEPEDAVIHITKSAMTRLIELREKSDDDNLVLRMGVRNGGCSGLSYVMDFSTADAIEEDDAVDEYKTEGIMCVVDAKSLLYLYGLELDYSDELIGGGFKFFNPNAEESCGCGSSFGV